MLLVMLHTRLFCVLGLIDTLWVCKLGFTHVLIRLVILPRILSCSAFIELLEEETLLYSVAYLSLKSSAMAASPRVLSIIGTVWHVLWKSNGCPRDGYFAEQRRITRARYHRAIRHIERNANKIRMEKMADAVLSNSSTDIWREVEKMKPKISSTVDGNDDFESIANMFSDKYSMLYNSVPYDTEEMKRIESEVLSRVQRGSDNNYCRGGPS